MRAVFLPMVATSMLMAGPVGAKANSQLCPAELVGAKAVTASLTATGQPKRNPSSGYERVAYEGPNITRAARPIQKIVVERSANVTKGTGHYLISFFARGTRTDLIPLLKAQIPAAKCEEGFCSGSAAPFPGAEGSLEYGSVQELDLGKVEVVFRCKYRDDAYGQVMKQGGLTAGQLM